MDCMKEYEKWIANVSDKDVASELLGMGENEIEDAFYRELEFGTGGLRGVIGAGTNRMNVYVVHRASLGLSNYIKKHFLPARRCIAISYDSRIKSEIFAKTAAEEFAANGIKVFIYSQLMPVPCLSFATRYLHCAAGVMITASHNPSKYNGYKVYGADGCQITNAAANEILDEINKLNYFDGFRKTSFEYGLKEGVISYIPETVYTAFIEEVKKQSVAGEVTMDKDVAIIYSPLNGTGLKPVLRTLKECGYTNVKVVKEQELPDGNFPTCPYPNPEIQEAMALGMEYMNLHNADLLLATDPDCDRVGIAVKDRKGYPRLLSGNQTGLLLTDYICSRRIENGTMPSDPVIVKTIVTTDMAEQIAARYGVRIINVLTGFKYIGEQIGQLERQGKAGSYIFGFEESYGYLSGTYVRDKDGVNAAFLICEMFSYYKSKGVNLFDKLQELYDTFGYSLNTLHSYEFYGETGFIRMQEIMRNLRTERITAIGGRKVEILLDYQNGIDDLPKSNVLKFMLEANSSVVVRPSGTEPKLKVYISVSSESEKIAKEIEWRIMSELEKRIKNE